jgi:hypothetical protein
MLVVLWSTNQERREKFGLGLIKVLDGSPGARRAPNRGRRRVGGVGEGNPFRVGVRGFYARDFVEFHMPRLCIEL